MADFNPVSGGTLNGGMLSLFDASYQSGLLVPHYLRTLKNKYGDNGLSDFQLLMGLGMKRGVQNTTGWHWEKGFYDSPITGVVIGAASTPAAPAPTANAVTIRVTSETGSSGALPSPAYIDLIYAKKGHVAMIVSGALSNIVYISDVTKNAVGGGPDTFDVTLQAVQASGLNKTGTPTLWAVGDSMTLGIIGSAWAEGSDQPASSQSFWTKYNWQTQIFKETYELTGTQKTNAPQWMEVESQGKTKKMSGFFYEGQDEAEYRLIKQIALSMMFGQQNNIANAAVPQTFSGLDAQIASRGANQVTSGTFGIDDLRTMATTMSKRYSSNLFLLWLTQEYYSQLNDSAGVTNTATSANGFGNANVNALNESVADVFYGGQMSGVESLMGTLSYNGLVVDGYNFMIKQARFMQDPQTLANVNANANIRNRGWAIPLNKMTDVDGVLRNRIELVYKEMDGYSRFMEVTDDGRASARKIGPSDVARLYLSSDLGFDFFTLEQFGRFTNS